MKRRNGEFIGSYAPYGYVKDPKDKHALLVDPEAAEVVKSIFSMFLSGMNKRGITYYLNDHGTLCPTAYKQQQGLKYNAPNAQGNPMWSTMWGIWYKAASALKATKSIFKSESPKKNGLLWKIPTRLLLTGKLFKRCRACSNAIPEPHPKKKNSICSAAF